MMHQLMRLMMRIKQLKEKFHTTTKRSEKVQVLTVLRKFAGQKDSARVLCIQLYGPKSKRSCQGEGNPSNSYPKPGHPLSSEVVDIVSGFYCSDDVSRMMPGKKDFVSVKQGERVHIQKRLVLSNQQFKDRFPNEFSKFAEL